MDVSYRTCLLNKTCVGVDLSYRTLGRDCQDEVEVELLFVSDLVLADSSLLRRTLEKEGTMSVCYCTSTMSGCILDNVRYVTCSPVWLWYCHSHWQ